MKPLVSVWMVTYNHERYIRQAIESVLNQNVCFDYEIVIGEDCSTDQTRAIIKELQSQHPTILKPLYHEKNVGASSNAYDYTLPACKGKYIAILEGDDYWTDPNKLQKQIDFLEANADYSGCAHQSTVLYENDSSKTSLFGENTDNIYHPTDMLQHRKFHTCSFVFRAKILMDALPFPTQVISADRAIYALLSGHGKIMYFGEPMCVYRKNNASISAMINADKLERDLLMLPWIKKHASGFPIHRLRSFLHLCIYTYGNGKISKKMLFKHFLLFSFFSFSYFPKNLGDLKFGFFEVFSVLKRKY